MIDVIQSAGLDSSCKTETFESVRVHTSEGADIILFFKDVF